MRRGAFWIALLGLSVQTAGANDSLYQAESTQAVPSSTAQNPGAVKAPTKYSRPASNAPAGQDLKNYYKELFGDAPPTIPDARNTSPSSEIRRSIPSQVGTDEPERTAASTQLFSGDRLMKQSQVSAQLQQPLKHTTQQVSQQSTAAHTSQQAVQPALQQSVAGKNSAIVTPVSGTRSLLDDRDIIQAEYRARPNSGGEILQVQNERFNARPNSQPAAKRESSQTPFNPFSSTAQDAAFPGHESATLVDNEVIPTAASRTASMPPRDAITFGSGTQSSFGRKANGLDLGDSPFQSHTQSTTSGADQSRKAELSKAKTMSTAAPAVVVEWQKQSEINVGQDCKCYLLVRNSGQSVATEVEVRATFPQTIRLIGAVPNPEKSDRNLAWRFDELRPGETKTIEISIVPTERGDINARADVRFSGVANGVFSVAEPMIAVNVEGPRQVMVGEPAAHVVTVSNPGTGIANDVKIEALIPDGLEHSRGPKLLMELGNLNPGESRSVRLALAATKGGNHHVVVQAKADAGLHSTSEAEVNVIAPMLATTIEGPGLRYLGRQAVYVMTVTNEGAAATDNVQLRYKVPEGFEFISADRGAQFDQATGLVTWFIGRLDRSEKTEIRATLIARKSGDFIHLARATSEHGTVADAECVTAVEGASSLAIAVKDFEDPVEIGSRTSYEVKIRNDGTASARNVGLTCDLPNGMSFVNAEGPAEYMVEGQSVLFRSIPDLAAGQTMTFKIHVTAAASGNLRFRALLSSETNSDPLVAEEMTRFYGER